MEDLGSLFLSHFQPEGEENCLPFPLMALIPQFTFIWANRKENILQYD
jgi:hypothetical protein